MLRFVLLNSLCPRQHTTAFVPSSGRIYSFGLGGNGQLGTGTTSNRKSPFTVKGSWIPYSTQCPMSTGKHQLMYLLLACLFLSSALKFSRFKQNMGCHIFFRTVWFHCALCSCCAGGWSPLVALDLEFISGKDDLNYCISEVLPQGNLFVTQCWWQRLNHSQFHIFTVACFLFLLQTVRSATV